MLPLTPQHEFLVAIDSDGCTFDTMEVKHKECFIPCFVNHYNLQAVSRFARECWEFVNLYSQSRGVNRFPALLESLDWLARRPEVRARKAEVAVPESLRAWVTTETRLGNPALEARVAATGDPALTQCLAWSKAVNRAIDDLVRHVPPFPFVRESLQRLSGQVSWPKLPASEPVCRKVAASATKTAGQADLIVCSATPSAALWKEWAEHQIDHYVSAVCGQEQGAKKELLVCARQYPPDHALMVGDALGDYAAAQANACLFFPINPGAEDASWQRFYEEGIDRFLQGAYAGEYQQSLLDDFRRYLPEKPSWR